jgi:Mn2+/Fe2+ NRAMP family transporter
VLRATFVPPLPKTTVEITVAVALLGTTVSPYLVVWQAQGESEVRRTDHQFSLAVADVTSGYVVSNLVSYFIMVTTASTIYLHGGSVTTAADAANALRPLVGDRATVLFGLGLFAAALLAIPIFGITSGYVVAELLEWPSGLSRKPEEAPGFYAVLSVAFLSGAAAALLNVDPFVALFGSQVLNGLVMPIIIAVLALIVNDRRVMGTNPSTRYYNVWLVISFLIMAVGAVALILRLG